MNSEDRITYFAATDCRNACTPFGIKEKDRTRHAYIIGKTGMGKSTLLENMAVQDIQNGEGITFIDPHGTTAEKLLDYVPENRIQDVLYFAPFDLEHPISFNVLEKVDQDKRHLVVNGLMSTFEKIWVDAWSARMAYILQNTLLALLEYPDATLLGVNRMYTDKEYRKAVVENVKDPSVKSFWEEEFAKYTDRFAAEATPAIQNKIGQFSSNALVRNIIGQPTSSFDLRKIMDEGKIFIVNLSKGRVGEGNANLLGSMLITKLYLAAMSRADAPYWKQKDLPNHFLYVDEFQSFANRSFADILSEARKYKLGLTIAHQYIEQMEDEVRAAVFGNVGTMVTFRVGSYDAEVLEKEFAPIFTAEDIVNLGFAQVYLKLMIDGISSHPFSATTLPPIAEPKISHRDRVIAHSRKKWGQPRTSVEEAIRTWHAPVVSEGTQQKKEEKKERREEKRKTDEPSQESRQAPRAGSLQGKNNQTNTRREPESLRRESSRETSRTEYSASNRPPIANQPRLREEQSSVDSQSATPPKPPEERKEYQPQKTQQATPEVKPESAPKESAPAPQSLRETLKKIAEEERRKEEVRKQRREEYATQNSQSTPTPSRPTPPTIPPQKSNDTKESGEGAHKNALREALHKIEQTKKNIPREDTGNNRPKEEREEKTPPREDLTFRTEPSGIPEEKLRKLLEVTDADYKQ